MKLIDILFVLTAAATANAILIPANNDGSPKASGTSSQMSGPTNEPNPEISDEDWQDIMGIINSSTSSQDQQPIDVAVPSTSSQDQQPIDVAGPSTSKRGRKQQSMDQSGPSTSKRGRKQQPTDVASSSSSKRVRKRPMGEPSPSTSDQNQQQPIDKDESVNPVPNQMTRLSEKDQMDFDHMRIVFKLSRKIAKEKRREYYEYSDLELEHQLALEMGKELPDSKYDPDAKKKAREDYKKASRKVYNFRRELKKLMKKYGLEFDEPSSDLD
ncbi:hypothetical protein O5D80_002473 [Batrachochytrium dendrobatidis]|nr:hypothetical protein O5D80_002473 [Batrachochytrium dendrobatidis]